MSKIEHRLRHRAKFNTAEDPYKLMEEAADEITRLRQLLSEADKREREARAKALEEAAQVAEKTGANNEDDWPGETWISLCIAAAIRALQSEER